MRAVLFDLGNVLVGLDPTWPTRIGVEPAAMTTWMAESEALRAFERGQLSRAAFYGALGGAFGVPPGAARDAFCSWVTGPLPGAVALLDGLTVPAYALSNTNVDHWSLFDPDRALRSRFTSLASHHLGARKPEPAVYAKAGAIVGTSDVLFLDDNAVNVEAARAHGWRAEQVVGVPECQRVLREAGLLG